MRVLHAADLHLGMVSNSWPDPATGLPSRLLDVASCWHHLARTAAEANVDAAVLAGDIFHTPSPGPDALYYFALGLRWLAAAEIPTVIIPGNHDRAPHPQRATVLAAFAGPLVEVVDRPAIVQVGPIRVACIPSVSRHQLVATYGGQAGVYETDLDLVTNLRRIIDGFRVEGHADLLTGHYSVAGSLLGGEKDIAIIDEPMLDPTDLEGPWAYAAFGHIHRGQPISVGDRRVGGYAGSIDRMNFGEEDYEPGADLLELDGATQVSRISTPARRFVTIDETNAAGPRDVADAIVRIRGLGDIAPSLRHALLEEGAASVRIEPGRSKPRVVRSAEMAEVPGPLQALDLYLDSHDVDQDQRPPIIERAREVVA